MNDLTQPPAGEYVPSEMTDTTGKAQGRWRVGSKVPRNLYCGDEPIAMPADEKTAALIADGMNGVEQLKREDAERTESIRRSDEVLNAQLDALRESNRKLAGELSRHESLLLKATEASVDAMARIAELERAVIQIRDICQAERLPCGQIFDIAQEALER